MRFWIIIFLILNYVFTCSGEIHVDFHLSQEVKNRIERIPPEERLFLENFFSKLIKTEGLGYVLFGDKPMCLSGYFIRLPLGNILRGSDNFSIKKGWEVWKKYEHFFSHPKYLIFEENHVRGDETIHPIYFINKINLLKTLHENKELFKEELVDNFFNPENFLEELCAKQSLAEMINAHEGLVGILLGFGAESSMNYYRRDLRWKSQSSFLWEEDNLEAVSQHNFCNTIFDIDPIQFIGNPKSQEVKIILARNAKERSHLLEVYSQGKLLEITLSKLMD